MIPRCGVRWRGSHYGETFHWRASHCGGTCLCCARRAVDDTEDTDLEEAEKAAERFPGIGRVVRERYASHSRGMERNSGLNRTGRREVDTENPFRIDV